MSEDFNGKIINNKHFIIDGCEITEKLYYKIKHKCNIWNEESQKLQQENQQLKERLKVLENVLVRDKFNFSKPQVLTYKVNILESRLEQYKSVLDEIRDYVTKIRDDYNNRSLEEKNLWIYEAYIHGVSNLVEILCIIDKVKE